MRNYKHNKRQSHLISVATLPCEQSQCIAKRKGHNLQLQLNQTGLAICVQVFD